MGSAPWSRAGVSSVRSAKLESHLRYTVKLYNRFLQLGCRPERSTCSAPITSRVYIKLELPINS